MYVHKYVCKLKKSQNFYLREKSRLTQKKPFQISNHPGRCLKTKQAVTLKSKNNTENRAKIQRTVGGQTVKGSVRALKGVPELSRRYPRKIKV